MLACGTSKMCQGTRPFSPLSGQFCLLVNDVPVYSCPPHMPQPQHTQCPCCGNLFWCTCTGKSFISTGLTCISKHISSAWAQSLSLGTSSRCACKLRPGAEASVDSKPVSSRAHRCCKQSVSTTVKGAGQKQGQLGFRERLHIFQTGTRSANSPQKSLLYQKRPDCVPNSLSCTLLVESTAVPVQV